METEIIAPKETFGGNLWWDLLISTGILLLGYGIRTFIIGVRSEGEEIS
jgi:hypothetical protein